MTHNLNGNDTYSTHLSNRAAMYMRSKKIRYLITFLAAMFVANNVAAAASACIAAVKGQNSVAVQILESVKHAEQGPVDGESCLTHCAQGEVIQQPDFAAAVYSAVSLPPPSYERIALENKPVAAVLSLAPPVIGPPFTILFHNFRN